MDRSLIEKWMRGGVDGEFSILESGLDAIPVLIDIFEEEAEADLREIALRNIWEITHSSYNPESEIESVIGVLGNAVLDPEPVIWKCALNGLVSIGEKGKKVLSEALVVVAQDDQRTSWIVEALEQCD